MSYTILYKGGVGEIVEKKSRFIASTFPINTAEEATLHIEGIRKKYYDARHNCFAYVIGEKNETVRSSDDGEPSGTAGHPILDVIMGSGIHNVLVVVTRYFGGTLLGTGGLVRAYSEAAKAGLGNSVTLERQAGKKVQIITDYQGLGKVQYIVATLGLNEIETKYEECVSMTLIIPNEKIQSLREEVTKVSAGKAKIREIEDVCYGIQEREIILIPI